MWRMLGTDRDTEMIIFTAAEDVWVTDFEAESWLPEKSDPVNTRYDHMFVDGRRMLIAQIQDALMDEPGIRDVNVDLTFSTPWDPKTMASDEIKMQLGIW